MTVYVLAPKFAFFCKLTKCILSHCLGHWWRSQTGPALVLIPKEHNSKDVFELLTTYEQVFPSVQSLLPTLFFTFLGHFSAVILQCYYRWPCCTCPLSQLTQCRRQCMSRHDLPLVNLCWLFPATFLLANSFQKDLLHFRRRQSVLPWIVFWF